MHAQCQVDFENRFRNLVCILLIRNILRIRRQCYTPCGFHMSFSPPGIEWVFVVRVVLSYLYYLYLAPFPFLWCIDVYVDIEDTFAVMFFLQVCWANQHL